MSCRIAVNMAKRAAAGATSMSVWSDEKTVSRFHVPAVALVPRLNRQHASQTIALRYDLGRVTAMAFAVFAALGFVSYAIYAHQWSELSAMRHLGEVSPAKARQ
jgi:hypothetical protein